MMTREPLKIYCDPAYLERGQTPFCLLWAHWNIVDTDPTPDRGRFDELLRLAPDLIRLVPLSEAEIAVAPTPWLPDQRNEATRELARHAANAGKKIVIFSASDSFAAVDVPAAIVWRTSGLESQLGPYEFGMPAWSLDFQTYSGSQPLFRTLNPKPTVGYCGYTAQTKAPRRDRLLVKLGQLPLLRRLAWDLALRGAEPPAIWRGLLVQSLQRSPRVDTRFVLRDGFWAGSTGQTPEGQVSARREHARTILDSDYTLCIRGAGNFSYRLYETLACGRTPLLIDTDCPLPFSGVLPWDSIAVKVRATDWYRAGSQVRCHYMLQTEDGWRERQIKIRQIWQQWISPEGFFAKWAEVKGGLHGKASLRELAGPGSINE